MIHHARHGSKAVFENVQPYKRHHRWHGMGAPDLKAFDSNRSPLQWLAVLSNIDKHRHLNFTSVFNEGVDTE